MTEAELKRDILETLAQAAPGSDVSSLDSAVSFRDQIEIDSIDFMNFVLLLEKRLGLKIPEIDYPKLSSLNGCLSYLKSVDTDSPGGV
ncbi:MAG: acyl carrier protein [Chromatiaceae bacterium]|nr:acyl carrier protein [Gammaproteobacteria bacterium]MCB1880073.1 acyl carrier protein [Gammaproteobacteria bacterium]MCP5448313.1 acyl carrier protein [Chromatiaceae bacterium]